MKRIMECSLWLLMAVFGMVGVPQTARAQNPEDQNYSRVFDVPRQQINDWLKGEVAKSGGDMEAQRYHFVIGFSTGHYGQDPVHAIATRRLAFSLLNNTLSTGDKVSAVAWEMNVWNKSSPIDLSQDTGTRKQFVEDVPYTPQQGSKGGHDTERALYDILTEAVPRDHAKSTIILLLTNSNQSQGPTGENVPLFGANNPKLTQAIKELGFRTPPSRQSFSMKTKERALNVDVTALFPTQMESLPGAPTTSRYPTFPRESWQPAADRPSEGEKLPNAVASASAGGGGGSDGTGGGSGGSGGGNGGGGGGGNGAGGSGDGGSGVNGANGAGGANGVNGANGADGASGRDGKNGGIPPWVWIVIVLVLLGGVAAYAMSRRKPKQPVPVAAAVPMGRPLPGAVEVVIGTKSTVLQPLTTISKWTLVRDGQEITLRDEQADEAPAPAPAPAAGAPGGAAAAPRPKPKAPTGIPLAVLTFDEKRRLKVQAEPDTQFLEMRGVNISESNNRALIVGVGERLFCRLASTGTSDAARLELVYHKDRK